MARARIPTAVMRRMMIDLAQGKTPPANTDAEREVLERLTRQVDEIIARGGIVEIPHEWEG